MEDAASFGPLNGPPMCCRKLFISQLENLAIHPLRNTFILDKVDFSRAWLQGVLVEVEEDGVWLDDGTGVIFVDTTRVAARHFVSRAKGMYLMVVGSLGYESDGQRRVVAVKVVDLSSAGADRQSCWELEVIDIQTKLYLDRSSSSSSS